VKNLLDNSPEGYEFVVPTENKKRDTINKLKKSRIANFLYKKLIRKFFNVWSFMNRNRPLAPENIDLIFSTDLVVEENKPWVIKILDSPFSMAGNDYKIFKKSLKKLEKALSSKNCKAIIVHTQISKDYIKKYFSEDVLKKVVILTPAIPERVKEKRINSGKEFSMLFMGSINNPEAFYLKGGIEALETFKKLSEKYKNIKLIMRSSAPKEIIKKYSGLKNVEFLEGRLTDKEMNNLYNNSDILLIPGYNYFIMAYLEAFSYGIPIIALDTYGVSEFIINGKNGFLVKPSKNLPINSPDYPVNARSEQFIRKIKEVDHSVIEELMKKASILIEDRKLLYKMSKNCQKMFKEKYSWEAKNKKLKRVFDEALM